MSLARTALRLAALEALAPFAMQGEASPPWPTMAGARVSDSQIEVVAETDAERRMPLIVVFADEAKTEGLGTALDATFEGAGREKVTLAFEIMVPGVIRHDAETEILPFAGTDAMAEGFLDMVEEQIRQRIADARTSKPLCLVLDRIEEITSTPWRDPDLDIRLSARRVEFTCIVRQGGRWPEPSASGLEALPSPLREVSQELPDGSYGRSVCEALARMLGDRAVFATLSEIRLAARLDRQAGDAPAPAPDPGAEPNPTGDIAGSVRFQE